MQLRNVKMHFAGTRRSPRGILRQVAAGLVPAVVRRSGRLARVGADPHGPVWTRRSALPSPRGCGVFTLHGTLRRSRRLVPPWYKLYYTKGVKFTVLRRLAVLCLLYG